MSSIAFLNERIKNKDHVWIQSDDGLKIYPYPDKGWVSYKCNDCGMHVVYDPFYAAFNWLDTDGKWKPDGGSVTKCSVFKVENALG